MQIILALGAALVGGFGLGFVFKCLVRHQLSDRNLMIGAAMAVTSGLLLIAALW
jgi:predicted permease